MFVPFISVTPPSTSFALTWAASGDMADINAVPTDRTMFPLVNKSSVPFNIL